MLANGVCMFDLRKLFYSLKRNFKNRIGHNVQGVSIKKYVSYVLSRLLAFSFLSLPIQVLFAEGIVDRTTNLGITEITSPKPGIGRTAASVATPVIANENASAANAITSIIATKHNSYLLRSDFQHRAEDLEALYKLTGNNLLWLGNAQAEKKILDVLNLLDNASVNGLNLTRYDTQTLRQKLPSALTFASDNYKELALYDTAISLSLLRFLHDLHYGRVNPKEINFNLKLRETKLIDLPGLIKTSLAQGTISQLPELVEPKLKQYKKLKQALANYRLLASNPALIQFFDKKSINLGSNLPQAEALREFLSKTGDLPEDKSDSDIKKSNRYSGELVEGIKKFQIRNGINAKGVPGINASLGQRITQIELAMERLRWLPEASAGASIIVNIPAFQLWAFDDVDDFDVDMPNMRVIVGKALKNQTPVLMAKMSFIDFMPYWNVPYSIVKKEILPKLIQNPGYLAGQNMELVSTFGNETKAVGFTGSSIAQLQQGTLRIRQRPGKKNALGKVKFIFPNKSDVYMHDTPSRSLFSKSRRDFSHGCVRVAKPDQLAEFALKNQLSKEEIQQALSTQKTRRVILKKSIPVTFFYVTSFIDHYENLLFYSDIYGHDAVLQDALNRSGDLSDEAIFAPPPELIPVEAIRAFEPDAQLDPVTN